MTERGEGLSRAPRCYTLGEQGQLRRRLVYALYEMRGLDDASREALAGWTPPMRGDEDAASIQAAYRHLAALLDGADIPGALPRNAASPARYRRPPARRR